MQHKVLGITPDKLSPDCGTQRVNWFSIYKAVISALKPKSKDINQKNVESSLDYTLNCYFTFAVVFV